MKVIGIREMKNKLSELVREVRRGETVLVTDRGTAVAELRQPSAGTLASVVGPELVELARAGLVRIGARNDPSLYPRQSRLVTSMTAAAALDLERGDR
jgi:antitoxin (DNA-binding transcriptional repressor) of toxin-antitoxin stability system